MTACRLGFLLMMLGVLCLPRAVARTTLDTGTLNALRSAPATAATRAHIDALAVGGNTADLLSLGRALESDADLDPATREMLLHDLIRALSRVRATPEAESWLKTRPASGVALHLWLEDAGRRIPVAVFDTVAAARFTLGVWHQHGWRESASLGLIAGDDGFLDDWLTAWRRSGGALSSAGLVAAFTNAPAATLVSWPARLARDLQQGLPVGPVAHVVALRMADQVLSASLIDFGDTASALRLVEDPPAGLEGRDRLALLVRALSRPDLASAAAYTLGRLDLPASRQLLIERLDEPELGSSAAAALARNAVPQTLDLLQAAVIGAATEKGRRRAVYALSLCGDPGRERLQQLLDRPQLRESLASFIRERIQ